MAVFLVTLLSLSFICKVLAGGTVSKYPLFCKEMEGLQSLQGLAAAQAAEGESSKDDGKPVDLSAKIEKADCYARNEASGFPMSNLFIGDSRLGCKSDADEQLILHIAFQEFVKIKSIKFVAFNNGADPESNPSKVHLYVNRENLGFEDCDDVDPTQTLHLTAEDLKEGDEPINLKYVLYQRVKSLTIFIEDNQGGETTALGALQLHGRTLETTNMADFKKQTQG